MLSKLLGPECPRCGCPESLFVAARETFADGQNISQESRECVNCGLAFQVRLTRPAPEFLVLRCPWCQSEKVSTSGSGPGGVRFHRCVECLRPFRSLERRGGQQN